MLAILSATPYLRQPGSLSFPTSLSTLGVVMFDGPIVPSLTGSSA